MTNRYPSATAFRQALEDRLRSEAAKRGVPINDLRQKLVMERLLARIFTVPDLPWLLKGGYAMDLRYRPKARTTRDLDLTANVDGSDLAARVEAIRDKLQDAAEADIGDHLVFRIGVSKGDVPGPPLGGVRFPVVAMLAGRDYARFHIDFGFGDAVLGEPELLIGETFFDFAGISPARVFAIPTAQQFAEKIHAYTFPWTDRVNTRVKDLVDMLVLIQRASLAPEAVRKAVTATFANRATHDLPREVPDAPESWAKEFASLAREAGLPVTNAVEAAAILQQFWISLGLRGSSK